LSGGNESTIREVSRGGIGAAGRQQKGGTMLPTILIIILILLLLGALPAWPYNRDWGYGTFAVVGLVLVIVLVLLVLGKF